MLLTGGDPVLNTYRVEVSGWDSSQSFFVEKSELAWDEGAGKQVRLSHTLQPGTMIFVRLLQSISPERSFPVAYHAEYIATTSGGGHRFRLSQVQPRTSTN